MKEYRVQRKQDGYWVMDDPYYCYYIHLEKAQNSIKGQDPEKYRVVQRDVTEWEPVTEA